MALRESPSCPTCGAEAPDAKIGAAYECKFCGARSSFEPPAPVVQPEIVRRVVVNAASGATSLACPRCELALFEGKTATAMLHGCGSCGGVWLDNLASQQVLGVATQGLPAMAERAAHVGKAPVDKERAARCPLDGDEMARVTRYGVVLDACAAHGTWFDSGEVKRLVVGIQNEKLAAIASVAGATYDYGPDAERALVNERYARGAATVLGAILTAIATPARR